MRFTQEEIEDEKALQRVEQLVIKELNKHQEAIGKTPLGGWSQEKHDKYHQSRALECAEVRSWIFIQLMRRNPD